MRHLVALVEGDVVVVAPLVDAHLLRRDVHLGQRTLGDVLAGEHLVDRQRGVMAVRDRPDDVLRAERGVAAEEHLRIGRAEGLRIDLGHVPLVELDAAVALDPGEGVLLADRDQHVVAFDGLVGLARRHQVARPLASYSAFTFWKVTPVSLPLSWVKATGTMKLRIGMSSCMASSFSQGEAFISSKPERTTTLTSSPPSRRAVRQQSIAVLPPPSTITRLPIFSMWPNETLESQSMPIWMLAGCFLAAGNVEFAAARRAGADEDRVVILGEQLLHALDAMTALELDAEVEDVVGLLVDHGIGQAEFRDLASASCRRPWGRHRTRCSDSRAARDRAPP